RQDTVSPERGLHVTHHRAHIASRDASGDGDHAPQIVARDLWLAAHARDVCDVTDRNEVSTRRLDREALDVVRAAAQVAGNPYVHTDHARVALDLRRDVAVEQRGERALDGRGVESLEGRACHVDLDV